MASVSEEQIQTRRRALGRKLISKASGIAVDMHALQQMPDLEFLSASEREVLERQFETMSKLLRNFNKLGDRLDKGQ